MSEKLKTIINEVINELYGEQDPMGFQELAMMIGRLYDKPLTNDSPEINVFVRILQSKFNELGDKGVMDVFAKYAGVAIKPVGYQEYAYDYSDNNKPRNTSQTQWNYKHAGD